MREIKIKCDLITFDLVKEISDSGLMTEQGVKKINDLKVEATTAHKRIKKVRKILHSKGYSCGEFKISHIIFFRWRDSGFYKLSIILTFVMS